ncbi:MAG: phosphate/phosphite/phosphonate ABC transporter substrate-binding protein [Verrucomicrobiae bacterium]|nr:phosphate/phosphite/phosphonate ABC transporter substrate-binding protein [Verrucomicrobiae bacterium]
MNRFLPLSVLMVVSVTGLSGHAEAGKAEPLVFAFQPQENPERLQLNARQLTDYLAGTLGQPVKVYIPTDYAAVVEALRAGHAHVAYLSAWPYLLAHQLAGVEIIAAEERAGKTSYVSQWYTRRDTGIRSLSEARGRAAAFTSPSSTSGYLFPLAKLVDEGLVPPRGDPAQFFRSVVFAGGYEQALKALMRGQVDVAAASDYAPARYLTDEEQAQLVVLSQQGPVPTHCLAVKTNLPAETRARIRDALLRLNDPEHAALLKSVYGAEKLVPVGHAEHTGPLARALELTGLDYPLKKK